MRAAHAHTSTHGAPHQRPCWCLRGSQCAPPRDALIQVRAGARWWRRRWQRHRAWKPDVGLPSTHLRRCSAYQARARCRRMEARTLAAVASRIHVCWDQLGAYGMRWIAGSAARRQKRIGAFSRVLWVLQRRSHRDSGVAHDCAALRVVCAGPNATATVVPRRQASVRVESRGRRLWRGCTLVRLE